MAGQNKQPPLATKNLLEDTDRLGRRNPSVPSRCGSPLLLLTCALLMTSSHSEGRPLLIVRALAPIKPGEEITIAYLEPTEAFATYRKKMMELYFFDVGEVDTRGFGPSGK